MIYEGMPPRSCGTCKNSKGCKEKKKKVPACFNWEAKNDKDR